jgi:hypothetical protein
MICQHCGVEADTKYFAFYQNIGMLVMRKQKSMRGQLCKSCIHKIFWEYTGMNLIVGWWGTISFWLTPCFIVNNIVRYASCLTMPAVGPDAKPPALTDDAVNRLSPHKEQIFVRLNRGEKFPDVAKDIAQKAGVTPGQVFLFSQALVRAAKAARVQPPPG